MNKKYFVIAIVCLFLGLSYGIISGHYQIFPFQLLKETKIIATDFDNDYNFNTPIYETDIQRLIHIENYDDILQKRSQLINYIWKDKEFPHSELSASITKDIKDPNFQNLMNLQRIDKIEILMDREINSIAYHLIPNESNNRLIIYHHGHDGDFSLGRDTIQFFLNKGYSVLAFSMPLIGMNNQPIVDTNFGKIKLISHNSLEFLESESFSPLIYFFEPILISLNYLEQNFDYESYSAVGISGGGWTVTVYSTLDDRISETYSVAGSVPIYMRTTSKNLGDYEQKIPEFYKIADYLDLYVMASYGENRKFVQIFNKYDPCCFSGDNFDSYESLIKNKISELGNGSFEIFIDESHKEHKISNNALQIISDYMDK